MYCFVENIFIRPFSISERLIVRERSYASKNTESCMKDLMPNASSQIVVQVKHVF